MDASLARFDAAWAGYQKLPKTAPEQQVPDKFLGALGTDPAACGLGLWMAEGKTGNTRIDGAVETLRSDHDRMHQGIAQIKTDVAAGRAGDALAALRRLVLPSRDAVVE